MKFQCRFNSEARVQSTPSSGGESDSPARQVANAVKLRLSWVWGRSEVSGFLAMEPAVNLLFTLSLRH